MPSRQWASTSWPRRTTSSTAPSSRPTSSTSWPCSRTSCCTAASTRSRTVPHSSPPSGRGASIVSYANAPGDWTTGRPKNFVTLISYDTFGMGAAVADEVHKQFPNGANLGAIYFAADYKLVNEREKGFFDQLAKYPNLKDGWTLAYGPHVPLPPEVVKALG